MARCEDIPGKKYVDGTTFTYNRVVFPWTDTAREKVIDKAREMAQQIVEKHQPNCENGECEDYVGCDCHPGEFYPHEQGCVATGSFDVVFRINSSSTSWGGWYKKGNYSVAISGKCTCTCRPLQPLGQPFDFLGLINTVAGGATGGKKNLPKTVADLIKWMDENL